jgi:hypothetical protein
MNPFTHQQLQTLSAEIDNQLRELKNAPASEGISKAVTYGKKNLPTKQKQELEQATGEEAESYLKKFARNAKKDLCEEGGILHDQFEELGNLSNATMLTTFGGILASMSLATVNLPTVAVAVSVIVIHIGIKAFCKECE